MLTAAVSTLPHTRGIKDGTYAVDGFDIRWLEVNPIIGAYRRMVRDLEFDICEMATTTYLAAKAQNKPFTALPIFLTRSFHHSGIVARVDSGVTGPKDLEGKRVGVRAYTVTTGVWTRGILEADYGVDLSKVTWVTDDEEHVQEYRAPANVVAAPAGTSLVDLFNRGDLAAAFTGNAGIGRAGSPTSGWDTKAAAPKDQAPETKPLFGEARPLEEAFYKRTGICPIHALIVVKDRVLAGNAGLADALYTTFSKAKDDYVERLNREGPKRPEDERWAKLSEIVGPNVLPYGLEENRASVEALRDYAYSQGLIPERVPVESLFVPVRAAART